MTHTNETVERIEAAAIIWNGRIFKGATHAQIFPQVLSAGADHIWQKMQGFVTSSGRFVSREDAMTIAIGSGQVTAGKTINPRILFSEDLW